MVNAENPSLSTLRRTEEPLTLMVAGETRNNDWYFSKYFDRRRPIITAVHYCNILTIACGIVYGRFASARPITRWLAMGCNKPSGLDNGTVSAPRWNIYANFLLDPSLYGSGTENQRDVSHSCSVCSICSRAGSWFVWQRCSHLNAAHADPSQSLRLLCLCRKSAQLNLIRCDVIKRAVRPLSLSPIRLMASFAQRALAHKRDSSQSLQSR